MRRLGAIVNELYSTEERPVLFWIDTLSYPTAPNKATSLAILEIRKTYSYTNKVLVIDPYFDIKGASISDTEILLRILCSL